MMVHKVIKAWLQEDNFWGEVVVVPEHPLAAQIKAVGQLPVEIRQDLDQLRAYISAILQETEAEPIEKIGLSIETLGADKAITLLRRALEIEGNGGMMVFNQSRRRTLGGIYFILFDFIKSNLVATLPLVWEERQMAIEESIQTTGVIKTIRSTITGRPLKVVERGGVALVAMLPKPIHKNMPRDLPKLPEIATTPYILYVAAEQWNKVKQVLSQTKNELTFEGYPIFSPKLNTITIFVFKATIKPQKKRWYRA